MSLPSNFDPLNEIGLSHAKAKERAREYSTESARRRDKHAAEIKELRGKRLEAMVRASEAAGKLGLIYHAKSNQFFRVVIPEQNYRPADAIEDLAIIDEAEKVIAVQLGDSPVQDSGSQVASPETEEQPIQPLEADFGTKSNLREETAEAESRVSGETVSDQPKADEVKSQPQETETAIVSVIEEANESMAGPIFPKERPIKPTAPELISMPVLPLKEPRGHWLRTIDWTTQAKGAVVWIGSIAVGGFIGFGLLNLAGLPFKKPGNEWMRPASYGLGIVAILSIKILFDTLWALYGKKVGLKKHRWHDTLVVMLITALFVGVEAMLGGQALITYSKNMSYSGKSSYQIWEAVMIAMAISSATLLVSAAMGYQKGLKSLTQAEIEAEAFAAACKQVEDQNKHSMAVYEEDLAEWRKAFAKLDAAEEAEVTKLRGYEASEHARKEELKNELQKLKVTHLEALHQKLKANQSLNPVQHDFSQENYENATRSRQEINSEFEGFRKLPDFQALCQYVSLVDALTFEIEEKQRDANNESISRGHGKKEYLF